MRFLAVAVLAASLMVVGSVNAQEGKEGKQQRGAAAREERLKKYDKNKDGMIDDEERKAMVTDQVAAIEKGEVAPFLLQRYDEDKDGKLSDAEKAKAIEAVKSGRGAGGPGGRGGAEFQKKLLERFDENKDGKLDDAEKAKARESRPARKKTEGK